MINDQIEIISVINAQDFEEFEKKVRQAEPFFNLVQIDIMDGKFVQTKNFGDAQQVKKIKTKLAWELHLMVQDIEQWVKDWLEVPRVKRIIFHMEPFLNFVISSEATLSLSKGSGVEKSHTVNQGMGSLNKLGMTKKGTQDDKIISLIKRIKEKNIQAGLALNPDTPLEAVLPYLPPHQKFGKGGLPQLDIVLLLTVSPGKSGQKFMGKVIHKIRDLRKRWPSGKIEVDGGINPATAKNTVDAGANVLASGSFLYSGKPPMAEAIKKLRNSIE